MLNTIILVIPLMLLLTGVEWYFSSRQNRHFYSGKTFFMNVAVGAMDQVGSLIYFTGLFLALYFMYDHFRFFTLSEKWYVWIAAYIAVDLLSYWYHRFSHRVNILWAGHVTHHSSDEYNFSNGFRTSFFQGINRIAFWCVLPLLGFSPLILIVCYKVSGLYDFFVHTQYVGKLGFLEKIMITPSHHRVHHGKNDQYIDKNFGSNFVIWDKMFGTFAEEKEEVRYGIKGPYVDDSPVNAITYYYRYMWHAMKEAKGIKNKLRVLILPPDKTPCPEAMLNQKPLHHENEERIPVNYAYFRVVIGVAGLIAMLLYKNHISIPGLIVCSVAGIFSVSSGVRIITRFDERFFMLSEIGGNILLLCTALLSYFFTHYFCFIPVIVLSGISLFIASMNRIAEQKEEKWKEV